MATPQALHAARQVRAQTTGEGSGGGGAVAKKPENFPAMLEAYKGEIAKALPKHINPDRMARIALTAFRMTPSLGKCDPKSVFAAVIQSSQLGLEVGLMGEAHLVPYGTTCQLIPGYTGLMKLARNSGQIKDIYAHVVRANDEFDIVLGLRRDLKHVPLKKHGFPASDEERGEIVGAYAVAVFKDGETTFEAMSRSQIEKIRDDSNGYKAAKKYKKASPWDDHFEAMAIKTVIRKLSKFLPKSPEMEAALALDQRHESGKPQDLNLDSVIDGTFTPVYGDEVEPEDENNEIPSGTTLLSASGVLEQCGSIEELDEAFSRFEGEVALDDLEALKATYRACKARLSKADTQQGSLV